MSVSDTRESIYDTAIELLVHNLREETMQREPDIARLPVELFTDAARATAEIELMRSLPIVFGHHSELPEPGSFITREVLGKSIIVVRRGDGAVGGYLNMCQHRGGRVESAPAGSKRVFTCQYHGWSYNRDDGALRNVPFGDDFGDIDMACHGLRAVHVEERHGLLWVDFSNDSQRSVAHYLGDVVDAQMADHALADTTLFMHQHLDVPVNWKLVMDGSADQLHVKFLHPTNVGKTATTGRAAYIKFGCHGRNFNARRRMERLVIEGGDLDAVRREFTRYIGSILRIYPNVNCIQMPDHVELWSVWPCEDPARSTVDIRFLVPSDKLDDAMAERVTRSWEILREAATHEDFPMEETIQQNATQNPGTFFTYGRNEISIRHLHECLARDLGELG